MQPGSGDDGGVVIPTLPPNVAFVWSSTKSSIAVTHPGTDLNVVSTNVAIKAGFHSKAVEGFIYLMRYTALQNFKYYSSMTCIPGACARFLKTGSGP